MSNLKTYPQTHRSFELQKMSVERCKAEFADCFHHKQQLAKESAELAKRLKKGVELIQWGICRSSILQYTTPKAKKFI